MNEALSQRMQAPGPKKVLACDGGGILGLMSVEIRAKLEDDLRTRLGSGLIYRLQPLSDGEKVAALTNQARERALKLSPESIDYLMRHAPRDMRTLSAFIAALDRYTLEHKRAVTLPLLRELLNETLPLDLGQ